MLNLTSGLIIQTKVETQLSQIFLINKEKMIVTPKSKFHQTLRKIKWRNIIKSLAPVKGPNKETFPKVENLGTVGQPKILPYQQSQDQMEHKMKSNCFLIPNITQSTPEVFKDQQWLTGTIICVDNLNKQKLTFNHSKIWMLSNNSQRWK